jgi:hypothetical protein
MSDGPNPKSTRDDGVAAVQHDFPNEEPVVVLTILDRCGSKDFHRERERVHLAILKLSKGNLRHVIDYTKAAERDYRDVLRQASDNPPPKLTEQEARQLVQCLMQNMGMIPTILRF